MQLSQALPSSRSTTECTHNVLLCWKMLTGNPEIHVGCSACKSSCQNAWEVGVWSWVMHSNFKATALRLVQRLNGSCLRSAHALRFESGFNSFKNCSHLQSVFFTWPTATWLYSTPRRSLPAPISIEWAIETNWQSHDAIFVEFPLSLEWLEQHSVFCKVYQGPNQDAARGRLSAWNAGAGRYFYHLLPNAGSDDWASHERKAIKSNQSRGQSLTSLKVTKTDLYCLYSIDMWSSELRLRRHKIVCRMPSHPARFRTTIARDQKATFQVNATNWIWKQTKKTWLAIWNTKSNVVCS